MKFDFHSWWSGRVIASVEIADNTPDAARTRVALEVAVEAGVSLTDARLVGAILDGASLVGARLVGAILVGASLVGARLDRASLDGASLDGASLVGASLVGASLVGASLDRARLDRARLVGARLVGASLDHPRLGKLKLIGERPALSIGPLGSRCATLLALLTDRGVMVRAGCFWDDMASFTAAVVATHGDGPHAREYAAAIALIECHAALWTPAERRDAA